MQVIKLFVWEQISFGWSSSLQLLQRGFKILSMALLHKVVLKHSPAKLKSVWIPSWTLNRPRSLSSGWGECFDDWKEMRDFLTLLLNKHDLLGENYWIQVLRILDTLFYHNFSIFGIYKYLVPHLKLLNWNVVQISVESLAYFLLFTYITTSISKYCM